MKKRLSNTVAKCVVLLVATSLTFYACKKELNSDPKLSSELANNVVLNSDTKLLSHISLKAGISEIKVNKQENRTIYKPKSYNRVLLNGSFIRLDSMTFVLEDDFLFLESDPEYKVSIASGKKVYIKSPSYVGYLENISSPKDIDTKAAALILVLGEITTFTADLKKEAYIQSDGVLTVTRPIDKSSTVSKDKLSKEDPGHGSIGCGSNYAITIGLSRSEVIASLTADLANTSMYNGCTKVGTMDTSCAFGSDHGCIATQAYNCPC